ncbi:ribbon-helix-helix domain-containing protein [Asticcacaulis sp. EMRT-3]|uniref:CopG family ribbon-helix-helix protein n=1 Tax=Asticcacaulis sp. EMRT-3 TaxID=3040349 RepID=UPI0024AFF63C|nr:ribbon-helix-helix domain-containing protein [Asticcacaulis sp. EMRT-3]MDI7773764.1 ribbon-helix-helix domain-containing protein [Asticcacaulis sp. EMRT-3]
MQTRTVTAHIPIELAEAVDAAAERLERPRGWIIKQALQSWISLEDRHHQMTLEALKEVDEGQFVEQGVIDAWIDGLD